MSLNLQYTAELERATHGEPQILVGLDEQIYRSHPNVANSDLTVIRRSPAHLMARRRNPEKVTAAKLDGRALHCAILEPNEFMMRYCVLPADAPKDLRHHRNAKDKSASTAHSIAWWDMWDANNAGRITLTADDYDLKMRTAEAVRKHPELRGYFEAQGQRELSVFAKDPVTGVGVKCRPDIDTHLGGYHICLDPKSTTDARPESFKRDAYAYDYFKAAAFYTDVNEWADNKIDLFLFIAFEKEDPFGVMVYEVSDDDMEFGRRQYRGALDIYAECLRNDDWPCYPEGIQVLTRPAWAKE